MSNSENFNFDFGLGKKQPSFDLGHGYEKDKDVSKKKKPSLVEAFNHVKNHGHLYHIKFLASLMASIPQERLVLYHSDRFGNRMGKHDNQDMRIGELGSREIVVALDIKDELCAEYSELDEENGVYWLYGQMFYGSDYGDMGTRRCYNTEAINPSKTTKESRKFLLQTMHKLDPVKKRVWDAILESKASRFTDILNYLDDQGFPKRETGLAYFLLQCNRIVQQDLRDAHKDFLENGP